MRLFANFFLLIVGAILCPVNVFAQSITMTAPLANSVVNEGDDYATNQLQNPWDFDQRRDIGWEENFVGTSVGVSGGVWSGTNQSAGAYLFPLFPGFKGALQAGMVSGDRSLPVLGINKPIDASRYTKLCYRINPSNRSTFAVYWSNDSSKPQYWPDGSNQGASYDGYYPYPWNLGISNTGWQIYCFNMSSLSSSFDINGGSWSGNVFALRLDPSTGAPAGATTQLDWVRLVDPGSAPNLTISWSTSGLGGEQMRTLYVDSDNSGFDGTPIARFITGTDPGTYTLNTAVLPPGDYYFYVTAQEAGPGMLTGPITYSGYTARLRINQAPQAYVTSPSQTSGDEYAASEAGNAWDMDSSTDVPNLDRANYPDSLRQFSAESFAANADAEDAGKVFQAMANPPLPGNTESDDQVWMNVPLAHPIQAAKYRYLTYRIAADGSNYPTISDKVGRGWVTRPIWWNNDVIADGGDPGAHVLYEGWHTYSYDLWTLPMERGIPWTSNAHLKHLRIDPLETNQLTWFFLDWVRLYAENHALNNQFTVSWNIQDADDTTFTVDAYYDTNNSGFDGTLIQHLTNVTPGANSIVWDTTGLTNGQSYWVYLVISDGVNTSKVYSPVHVVIGDFIPTPVPRTGRADFDYNGDAKSDLADYAPAGVVTIIRPARKGHKAKTSTSKNVISKVYFTNTGATAQNSHVAGAKLFGADINGDHLTDLLTVYDNPANGLKYFQGTASRTATAFNKVFGVASDVPFKSDFDGNLTDEIGVFRSGFWYAMNELNQVYAYQWGTAGDIAVPADYDGDGLTDLSIWRPSTGEWWMVNSGFSGGYATEYASHPQWGLAGDVPVPGDYDGDGRDDCAVWRPTDGNWYIRYSRDGSTAVVPWGHTFFGDIPFSRLDLNGDGKADFVVFRPSVATWFIKYSTGATAAILFGATTDILPVNKN